MAGISLQSLHSIHRLNPRNTHPTHSPVTPINLQFSALCLPLRENLLLNCRFGVTAFIWGGHAWVCARVIEIQMQKNIAGSCFAGASKPNP